MGANQGRVRGVGKKGSSNGHLSTGAASTHSIAPSSTTKSSTPNVTHAHHTLVASNGFSSQAQSSSGQKTVAPSPATTHTHNTHQHHHQPHHHNNANRPLQHITQAQQHQPHTHHPHHPPPDPTFDHNAHPFHAPLDHVREEERPLQELSAVTHFDVATLRKLQVIFTDIAESDVDDGIIDGNELTDAMGLAPSCLLARTIFRIFTYTHQKKIDFGQWARTISALSPLASLEEKIRFSFGLYDLNGDGEIDVEELRAMLEAAVLDENVLHLSPQEVREWCDHTLSQVDKDGNGKIDYEEYRSMVKNSVKFLESFTLDIQELCSQLNFKKRTGGDQMTAHEIDQRLLWFRQRQRQHNGSNSTQSSVFEDGSQQRQEQNTGGSGQSNPQPNGSQTTPAPPTVAAMAAMSPHGKLPPSGSGSLTWKSGSGTHKPLDMTVHSSNPGSHHAASSTGGARINLAPPLAHLDASASFALTPNSSARSAASATYDMPNIHASLDSESASEDNGNSDGSHYTRIARFGSPDAKTPTFHSDDVQSNDGSGSGSGSDSVNKSIQRLQLNSEENGADHNASEENLSKPLADQMLEDQQIRLQVESVAIGSSRQQQQHQ